MEQMKHVSYLDYFGRVSITRWSISNSTGAKNIDEARLSFMLGLENGLANICYIYVKN